MKTAKAWLIPIIVTVCIVFGSIGPAVAQTFYLTPGEVLSGGIKIQNPRDGYNDDAWSVNGPYLDYSGYYGNNGSGIISPESFGDVNWHVKIQDLGYDDDRYGLILGYQDGDNHYRLSWEGRWYNDGYDELDGSRGLSLIREVNGVSVSLFNQQVYWTHGVAYNMDIFRDGDTIGFKIENEGFSLSFSVVDTAFMTGAFGIWNSSQETRYWEMNYTVPDAVPVPPAIWLLGSGLAGLAAWRRRKRA